MFWEDWSENLCSVVDAVVCCPDPQRDWGTHFLSCPCSRLLMAHSPSPRIALSRSCLARGYITFPETACGDGGTGLVSFLHLRRMIQLQSSLGEGLTPLQQLHCSSAVGSAFLRAWDLATKRQITLIFPGFRFSKDITISGELFRESPSCFWALEKLFWCLPPHYANPSFRSSLLNIRNRWKSLGHGI